MNRVLFFILLLGLGLAAGITSVILATIGADNFKLIAGVPLAFCIVFMFFKNRAFLLKLLILFRVSIDSIIVNIRIAGLGMGFLLNMLMIVFSVSHIKSFSKKERNFFVQSCGGFVIVLLLSQVGTVNLFESFKQFINLLSALALFVIGYGLVNSPEQFQRWVKIVLASSVIPMIYALIEKSFGLTAYFAESEGYRLQSTFYHPNILGIYCVFSAVILMFTLKAKVVSLTKTIRLVLPLYLIVILYVLLLAKTRSAWIACALFFVIYSLLFERKYLIYIAIFFVAALSLPEVQDRLVDTIEGHRTWNQGNMNSYTWRTQIWSAGLHWMSVDKYFFGYGPGSFKYYSTTFYNMSTATGSGAHNIYVQMIFEFGAIGIIAYVFLMFNVIKSFLTHVRKNLLIVFFPLFLIFQYSLIGYSDNLLEYTQLNWMYWFTLGLFLAFLNKCSTKA